MRVRLDVVQGRAAPQTVVVDAEGLAEAKLLVQAQGYTVVSAALVDEWWSRRGGGASVAPLTYRTNQRDVVIFVEQLHALLQAGLSVIEALDTLQAGTSGANRAWADTMAQIVTQLRQGQTLSKALERQPGFPPLLTAMVRSAELTSDLPQALTRFLEHQQRTEQVRHQLTSVSLYPLLLMSVGGCVMLFLMFYVMPRFARVFESMNNLPWSARAMVSWSHLLKAHGLDVMIALGILVATLASILALPAYRGKLLARLLDIPLLARHLRTYFLARWYRTTGMLVEGGIPLPESLNLANQVLPLGLQHGGAAVELAMRQGLAPSQAYVQSNMATAVAAQLLRAGERSGDVGVMLRRAAVFHETEVAKSLEKAMRIIEPLVMTFIGLGVGVVVILMYLPIFELASAIQ
jgi:general secretion pathway protein F